MVNEAVADVHAVGSGSAGNTKGDLCGLVGRDGNALSGVGGDFNGLGFIVSDDSIGSHLQGKIDGRVGVVGRAARSAAVEAAGSVRAAGGVGLGCVDEAGDLVGGVGVGG